MKTDSTELSSPTGIYSDREIAAALADGHIVCDPAPARINGSSVDVTLGYYFIELADRGRKGYLIHSTKLTFGATLVNTKLLNRGAKFAVELLIKVSLALIASRVLMTIIQSSSCGQTSES